MEEMVQTSQLVYEYKTPQDEDSKAPSQDVTALNDVSLTIEKGEFVAVLGHNGSGKSTLAKLINALLTPTSGKVLVLGMDTKDENNIWNIRQSAGMVFQNPDNQIVATIVEDDVAFGAENLGVPSDEIRRRVDDALEAVGMTEYATQSPHFLSGGQKQRVAIAGILAMKPSCIIFDEPTAMLDPSGRREVMEAAMRLNREEGITIILITHYMDEAAQANRIIVMDEGKIVMDGVPRKIFTRADELRAIGLEVPQITEVALRLRDRGIDLPCDILTIEEMVQAICQYQSRA